MARVPVTLQVAQTECGLAAARSLLAYHGHDVSTTDLRCFIEPGRDGLSLRQIAEVLRARGMELSMYRVKALAGLERLDAPFIAHWKGYHFVVVEKLTATHAIVMDPMIGRTRVTRESVAEDFSGQVLVATPGEEFESARRPAFAPWRGKPLWPQSARRAYAALIVLSLLLFGFTLSIPLLTERLVDDAVRGDLSLSGALTIIAGVASGFIGVYIVRTYVTTRLVRAVSWRLLNGAFEHLVRLPLKYFMSRPPGELMYRLNSMNQVRDIIATKLVQGALDAMTALVLLGYVFYVAVPLGLATVATAGTVVVLLLTSQRLVKQTVDTEVHHNGRTQGVQLDAVVSITNLRIGGYASTYLDDWRSNYREALTAMVRRMRIQQGWIGGVITGVQSFAPLAILVTGLVWVTKGWVTIGEAVAVQGVSALLFGLCASVFQSYTDGTVASRYLERVDDIFAYPPERTGGNQKELPDNSIELDHVGFRYTDHSPEVLKSLTTRIEPGSVVALVGESGSGKTTLGKIICSLYQPSSGTIRFGGVPVDEYDLDQLRKEIGYIPQEGYLHNRTVAENLTLGTGATEEEAIARCHDLPFMNFIEKLPMGYRTVISEMGANFSGGQRQRIAIAKAIIRGPKILVLDEATSALDNANQRLVHSCIAELECTQVIIAHRLSTVVNADLILVLEDGAIEAFGTHDELASGDGAYARMFGSSAEMAHG
ncbi:MAG: peptidase domain-containing ABC transporter [Actinomycetia bacterium]|nr:peptidase domain-containing ABC transporter [Actinomycetes bacterium]